MKVYVAGKWSDSKNISEIISNLKEMGIEITFNWPHFKDSLSEDEKSIGEYENISDERVKIAKKCVKGLCRDADLDIKGVLDANIVIAVMNDPHYAYRGTFTEIGAALGSKKEVFIIDKNDESYAMTNCFYWHPSIKHYKDFDTMKNDILGLKLWYS